MAKGHGVDVIARLLEKKGFKHFMVEIGGEITTRGKNKIRKSPWTLAIESPEMGKRKIHRMISLQDTSIATSGDYRNYFEKNGQRYSHTIDPLSGYPITHNLASVSVIHPICAYADAYATGFLVLGLKKGMEMAKRLKLAVHFVAKGPKGFYSQSSPEFKRLFPSPLANHKIKQ